MPLGQSVMARKLFPLALSSLLMIGAVLFDNSLVRSRAKRNLGIVASVFGTHLTNILPNSCLDRRWPRKADSATALSQSFLLWRPTDEIIRFLAMRCQTIRSAFRTVLAAGLIASCQNATTFASWKDCHHPIGGT